MVSANISNNKAILVCTIHIWTVGIFTKALFGTVSKKENIGLILLRVAHLDFVFKSLWHLSKLTEAAPSGPTPSLINLSTLSFSAIWRVFSLPGKGVRKVAVEEARMVSQRAGAVVPEPKQFFSISSYYSRFPPMPGPFTAAIIGFGNSMNTLNIFSLFCLEIWMN